MSLLAVYIAKYSIRTAPLTVMGCGAGHMLVTSTRLPAAFALGQGLSVNTHVNLTLNNMIDMFIDHLDLA
jgi:hypothetical protein